MEVEKEQRARGIEGQQGGEKARKVLCRTSQDKKKGRISWVDGEQAFVSCSFTRGRELQERRRRCKIYGGRRRSRGGQKREQGQQNEIKRNNIK